MHTSRMNIVVSRMTDKTGCRKANEVLAGNRRCVPARRQFREQNVRARGEKTRWRGFRTKPVLQEVLHFLFSSSSRHLREREKENCHIYYHWPRSISYHIAGAQLSLDSRIINPFCVCLIIVLDTIALSRLSHPLTLSRRCLIYAVHSEISKFLSVIYYHRKII